MLTIRTLTAVLGLHAAAPVAASCADVALVLAIDASGSVEDDEFALQQQGYAQAFLSPRVQAALSDAGIVDIGAVVFSDSEPDLQVMPMTRLVMGTGAEDLARRLKEMPRPVPGTTGIGIAIAAAIRLLDAPDARVSSQRKSTISDTGSIPHRQDLQRLDPPVVDDLHRDPPVLARREGQRLTSGRGKRWNLLRGRRGAALGCSADATDRPAFPQVPRASAL